MTRPLQKFDFFFQVPDMPEFWETRFASSGDDAAAPFIMAAAAMTVLRLGAFAPQATRLRRSAGSTATRPPARRACAVKAAGGDQVPGLWYVDEESQGEHPTSALRFLLSFTHSLVC